MLKNSVVNANKYLLACCRDSRRSITILLVKLSDENRNQSRHGWISILSIWVLAKQQMRERKSMGDGSEERQKINLSPFSAFSENHLTANIIAKKTLKNNYNRH